MKYAQHERIEAVRRLADAGKTRAQAAGLLGIAYVTLAQIARDHGIVFRRRDKLNVISFSAPPRRSSTSSPDEKVHDALVADFLSRRAAQKTPPSFDDLVERARRWLQTRDYMVLRQGKSGFQVDGFELSSPQDLVAFADERRRRMGLPSLAGDCAPVLQPTG